MTYSRSGTSRPLSDWGGTVGSMNAIKMDAAVKWAQSWAGLGDMLYEVEQNMPSLERRIKAELGSSPSASVGTVYSLVEMAEQDIGVLVQVLFGCGLLRRYQQVVEGWGAEMITPDVYAMTQNIQDAASGMLMTLLRPLSNIFGESADPMRTLALDLVREKYDLQGELLRAFQPMTDAFEKALKS